MRSFEQDVILKEMGLLQEVMDKQDGWFLRMRIGCVVGLFALVSSRFISSGHVKTSCLVVLEIALPLAIYIGEVIVRWTQQYGYIRRQEVIKHFLNTGRLPYEFRLYAMKEESAKFWQNLKLSNPEKVHYCSWFWRCAKFWQNLRWRCAKWRCAKFWQNLRSEKGRHCFWKAHYVFYLLAPFLSVLATYVLKPKYAIQTLRVLL